MKNKKSIILYGILIGCIFFTSYVRSQSESKALNKIVTPNNDNRNDTFIFKIYNPQDAKVSGKIYDLNGKQVSIMTDISQVTHYPYSYIEWDPNLGNKMPTGIYIYQIVIQDKVYTGTVVVIR